MTLRLNGSASGYTEIDAPAVAGNNTLVLPTGNGVAGQVLSTNGSGAMSWVDRFSAAGPAFYAYRNGNIAISNSVSNKVPLNAEIFDTANCFDSATNYRFTPNVAGYYWLSAAINLETSSSPSQITRALPTINKNGTENLRGIDLIGPTNSVLVSGLLYLNGTTDYVEVFIYTEGATTPRINGTSSGLTHFSGFLARPA